MKIRTRLTLLFTFLIASLLLVFSLLIYASVSIDRESEFYETLRKEATTKATVLMDVRIDAETLQTLYRNNREILYEVEVAIYDADFNLLYHDAVDIDFVKETPEMIDQIISNGELRFVQDDWQVLGFRFVYDGVPYAITAAAYDESGLAKLDSLRNTLFMLWLVAIIIIFISGRYFSRKALWPVSEMIDNVDNITANNLHQRLTAGQNPDEIAELAQTFNDMLDRLEQSFESQKLFVSNISHELRTPLAAIITELEIALTKDRTADVYRKAIEDALNDAKKLRKLSSMLLDLAKANYDKRQIHFTELRIDELLIDAGKEVLKANPEYKVELEFETEPDADEDLTIRGNEYLLKVAWINLIDNACKFSDDHQCRVTIGYDHNGIKLDFIDHGKGISPKDIDQIFIPFFRGNNGDIAGGHGIGLSLAQRIIHLHQGSIKVDSKENAGSVFSVFIPH